GVPDWPAGPLRRTLPAPPGGMMRAKLLASVVVLAVAAIAAYGQAPPLGPPFKINEGTSNLAFFPRVASTPMGGFVVVWEERYRAGDGDGFGVLARRYDASGAPLGSDFLVNELTTSHQSAPALAVNASGEFIVVWETCAAGCSDVSGRLYDASGSPLTGEFAVNSFTPSNQSRPRAVLDDAGSFVVVWSSYLQDGSLSGVFGRRFDSSAVPLGPDYQLNSFTTGNQSGPDIVLDPAGGFL